MAPKKSKDLNELPDVFLICSTVGHDWEPRVIYAEQAGRREVHRMLWYCGREERAGIDPPTEKETVSIASGAGRGQLLSPTGMPRYADGYLLEKGSGVGRGKRRPMARAELGDRLEVLGPGNDEGGERRDDRKPAAAKRANPASARRAASTRKSRQLPRRRR